MKLGDIAEIKTGIVLTRKKAELEFRVKDNYRLLSLRNIDEDGTFNQQPFEIFASNDRLSSRYFTEKDDIVMRLSDPNTAVYIDQEHTGLLVPSNFVVIKVNDNLILPEYLAWYLNKETIKQELERSQSGSRILSTNKNVLKSLSVHKLPLQRQEALIKILRLHQKEKMLYKNLLIEKEKWFNGVSQKLLKG